MLLKDKVALVTGAGSGIGRASALALAKEGAQVGILGRTKGELQTLKKQIEKAGRGAHVLVADVSKPAEMERACKELAEKFGGIHIVHANAGINGVWAPIDELTPEEWDETIDINLKGTFLTIKYAAPYLKKYGGSVIVTSSVNGSRIFSSTGATAYSTSKAGQVAMAKMLALELAKYRVRVNVICPGWIETDIDQNSEARNVEKEKEPVTYPRGEIPLTDGKPPKPDTVADLVVFLASDNAKHITGTEIYIDGAESLLVAGQLSTPRFDPLARVIDGGLLGSLGEGSVWILNDPLVIRLSSVTVAHHDFAVSRFKVFDPLHAWCVAEEVPHLESHGLELIRFAWLHPPAGNYHIHFDSLLEGARPPVSLG